METINTKKSSHMMFRGEKLDDNNSILIESKFENGTYYDEVFIQSPYVAVEPGFALINGKSYVTGLHTVSKTQETKLGSHITYDNEGLKGWVEYNKQHVAFIEYSPKTGQRKIVKLFDVIHKEIIDGTNCELEQLYQQSFAVDIMTRQAAEIPIKKLELKNNCIKN